MPMIACHHCQMFNSNIIMRMNMPSVMPMVMPIIIWIILRSNKIILRVYDSDYAHHDHYNIFLYKYSVLLRICI